MNSRDESRALNEAAQRYRVQRRALRVRCSALLAGALIPWLRSRHTPKKALDAEVFVDFRPMNAFAVTEELPVPALLIRSGEEAREPDQRHRDSAAVGETDDELGRCEPDRACLRRVTSERSTHATQRLV